MNRLLSASLASPCGFALFEKRPHPFACILTGADSVAKFIEVLVFHLEGLADCSRDHMLHRAYRQWRIAGDRGSPLASCGREVIVRYDLMNEAHLTCAVRIDRIRQIHDFGGICWTYGFDEFAEDPIGWQV